MTLSAATPVKDIVAEDQRAARVFEKLGIDYCCGGEQTLESACQVLNLSPEQVLKSVGEAAQPPAAAGSPDWETASLSSLSRHIVEKHHTFSREESERIAALLVKTVQAHGANHPELRQIQSLFSRLSAELNLHMMKEEQTLFPMIEKMEMAWLDAKPLQPFPFGSIRNPISMMIYEHNDTGDELKEIRKLSKDYSPPADACNTYRSLFEALKGFEEDMHRHIYLENYVLFPRTVALERGEGPAR